MTDSCVSGSIVKLVNNITKAREVTSSYNKVLSLNQMKNILLYCQQPVIFGVMLHGSLPKVVLIFV